jgi:hypothetical protein
MFELSIELFFDSTYSCLVLDDGMIGSKAGDVETKIVSDRKAAGKGPTCDCICDSFFQFVLGFRIKTVADSQSVNVQKLLDYLPSIDENRNSMLGPFIACDRGYSKKSIITLLASRHYKVITIASKIGLEHPIVGSSVVDFYIEKIKNSQLNATQQSMSDFLDNYGVLQSDVNSFLDNVKVFTISDDPTHLLGLEVIVAENREVPTLCPFAYPDIYDKKVEQKLLRFFIYDFPNLNYIFNTWICFPKALSNSDFKRLFDPSVGRNDNNTRIAEEILSRSVSALTRVQRTAECSYLEDFISRQPWLVEF